MEFETDVMLVVEAIHKNSNGATEFGALMGMCNMVLANEINFYVSYILRQANVVAPIKIV